MAHDFELDFELENFTGLMTLNLKGSKKFEILPSSIHLRSLQTLNISGCSNLKTLPGILEVMDNLSELHLDWTIIKQDSAIFKNLTELEGRRNFEKFPQFSGIAIEELPSSLYNLTGLVTLTLRYSKSFKSLTSRICQLKSLTYLSLSGCTKLEVFPEILENMEQLASLDLDETSIRVLPPSIKRLQGLVSLNLKNCKRLVYLPDSICNLLSLEWLNLSGCSTLSKLPEDLWYLKRLDVRGAGIREYNNHGPAGSRPNRRFFKTLGELAQFRSSASSSDLVDSSYEKRISVSVREWVLLVLNENLFVYEREALVSMLIALVLLSFDILFRLALVLLSIDILFRLYLSLTVLFVSLCTLD